MTTRSIGSPSTFSTASTARTTGPTIAPPSAEELKGVKSAKELGANFKLSVNKDSKQEEVAKDLAQLVGAEKGKGYAAMIEMLGPTFKTRALEGIQKEVGEWAKANPNATPAQVFEQASKIMMKQVLMQQTFKQTIDQMTSAALSRMKDTFEG